MAADTPIPSRIERRKPQGPWHDFWLLRESERSYAEYSDLLGRRDAPVRLSDDIRGYLNDTLQWIPTLDPIQRPPREGHGLNVYGPTVIRGSGAGTLAAILRAWVQLFEQGPALIELGNGVAEVLGGETPPEYFVDVLQIEREPLLHDLRQLASLAEQAVSGDRYILHLGI